MSSERGRPGKPAPPARGNAGDGRDGAGGTKIPYEQARDQLTEVVRRLESGGLTLEESLALWERGEQLAAICSEWLEGARARLAAAMPAPGSNGDNGAPF